MDTELDSFKSNIDLRAYASSQGFQLDRTASWRGSSVMRHPLSDEKIVIKRGMDNHYIWFSVRSDAGGSIVDFVQYLTKLSLGAVRKELRPWIGQNPLPVPAFAPLHKTEKDRMKVEAAYARMKDATDGHPYLENERALPASLLASERFAGRIRIDHRGNAVFPHFDAQGLSGYELKGPNGWTGFASGGVKALWMSHARLDDARLVITESAIDALSHAVLLADDRARYASIGGKPSPQQTELVRTAAAGMPLDSEIVSAMDADADGAKLAEVVRKAVALTGRLDLKFTVQEPFGHKDWNDQLRARPKSALPSRVQEPFVA